LNERIKALRKVLGMSQDIFAEKLGLTKNYISLIENGNRNLSEQSVKVLCKEFNVSEEWLRNGTGEMFLPVDRNADIARLTKQLLDEESDSFKNRLISILSNLSVEEWQYLEKRAKELCGIDDLHNSD
jgi:transcriptional regulator with XRE-family HTH domain